jgi:NAD(P)-dependent dehydrogenase (short-subunit alcohol dehydrogenase family)
MNKALAVELAKAWVSVNIIAPAFIEMPGKPF